MPSRPRAKPCVPKTTKGRVVYRRKPHLFTYTDVLRIVRVVEIPQDEEGRVKTMGVALAALLAVLSDVYAALRAMLPKNKVFWAGRALLILLEGTWELASQMPEVAGRAIQAGVDFLLTNVIDKKE